MIDVLRCPRYGPLGLALAFSLLGSGRPGRAAEPGNVAPAAVAPAVGTDRHPVVPGFERYFAPTGTGRVEGGLLLLGELNCTSCHAADGAVAAHVLRKQAPVLDKVGSRVRPSYLRTFLSDPQAVKPGTTMPHLFAMLPEAEKAATVEALVHFLATTGRVIERPIDTKAISSGKRLYHQAGCVACHGPREERGAGSARLAASMPLGALETKYTMTSLTAFLQDPLKVRPSGRMPALSLVKKEPADLASYLLQDLKSHASPSLTYRYYEGSWEKLPDFAALSPTATGTVAGFDLSIAKRENQLALQFEGYFPLAVAGEYTFHLTSDDGSRLEIDDRLVIDNDGIHPPATATGKVELKKGVHRLVVSLFNGGGEAELDLEYEGRGLARQSIVPAISLTAGAAEAPPGAATGADAAAHGERFTLDRALAEKGRAIFERVGCASCHELRQGNTPIASTLAAPPLAEAARGGDNSCVALAHAQSGLLYRLSDPQRSALLAALRAIASGSLPAPAPRQVVARTMTAFNCYACHVRDGRGGVEEARQEFFQTSQKEMGDEGRIPPSLDGVGAKLQPAYMRKYFESGVKDRPYMLTRMPRFGAANLEPLIAALESLDPLEPVTVPRFDESPKRVKSIGRFLAGGEALGCVKCHTFKGIESEGVQAVDMTVLTRRLRHDWFHRYLVDTQAYRPGTRMPTAWPSGKSLLPQVLAGDTPRQIEALWQFLSDGSEATEPYGLGREPMPLVPEREPIIYRGFLKGAGPRAIGVGYPERVSLAFDANDLRLAMVWQGAFLDASRHWGGRGVGFQPPLGDNVISLPEGPALAFLSNSGELWPEGPAKALGDAFRGYRLAPDGRPTFQYDIGTVHVEDTAGPVPGKEGKAATLRRSLTFRVPPGAVPPQRELWFRAAAAKRIEPAAGGRYTIDGEWTLRIQGGGAPLLRKSAGKSELLVPLGPQGDDETRLVQEFDW